MAARIKLTKLDGRYDGHRLFTHRAEFENALGRSGRSTDRSFAMARDYLWTKHGASVENTLFHLFEDHGPDFPALIKDPKWAWSERYRYLYLRDQALTEFLLVKEKFEMA